MLTLDNIIHILSTKTLLHGTCTFNEAGIREHGLIPTVGPFVSDSYGCELDPDMIEELVFAADKSDASKALGGIASCIAHHLGIGFHDVTDEQIKQYGMLVVISGDPGNANIPESWEQRPEDDDPRSYVEYPSTVEPRDYYSRSGDAYSYILKGSAMLRYLKRLGAWPRDWPLIDRKNIDTHYRNILIKKVLRLQKQRGTHKYKSKQDIIDRVRGLPTNKLRELVLQYSDIEDIGYRP